MKSLTSSMLSNKLENKHKNTTFKIKIKNLSSVDHLQLLHVPLAVGSLGNKFNDRKGAKFKNWSHIHILKVEDFPALVSWWVRLYLIKCFSLSNSSRDWSSQKHTGKNPKVMARFLLILKTLFSKALITNFLSCLLLLRGFPLMWF